MREMSKQQIGVVGLAVMGKNLALNIESRGFTVSVFNRSAEKTKELLQEAPGKQLVGTYSIEEFVQSLEVPRKILIMVKAGGPTDDTINQLVPYLDKGDILIDGGNAFFPDTQRRNKELASKVFASLARVFPAVKKARLKAQLLCQADKKTLINSLSLFLQRFLPK